MKPLNLATLVLTIIGGINWGLIGLFDFNLVAAILGDGSVMSRVVYVIVGLSALWQLAPLSRAFQVDEPLAERNVHLHHR